MTMYTCQCGQTHNSATQVPCSTTITIPFAPGSVRALWTTELDRFMLAAALRARHPRMSSRLQALHDRLLPTQDDRERGREFAEFMAKATPEERTARLKVEEQRCIQEDVFIQHIENG